MPIDAKGLLVRFFGYLVLAHFFTGHFAELKLESPVPTMSIPIKPKVSEREGIKGEKRMAACEFARALALAALPIVN